MLTYWTSRFKMRGVTPVPASGTSDTYLRICPVLCLPSWCVLSFIKSHCYGSCRRFTDLLFTGAVRFLSRFRKRFKRSEGGSITMRILSRLLFCNYNGPITSQIRITVVNFVEIPFKRLKKETRIQVNNSTFVFAAAIVFGSPVVDWSVG